MNKTVLRRYVIKGVDPAILKSPKLFGKGDLKLSALISKLAEAEGQEPTTYETWIGEPFASCLVFCGNDLFGDNAVKCDVIYTWIEEQEYDENGDYIDSRVVAEPGEIEWRDCTL
ncbi:hypothetical protein [Ruminobacter sp.]|uniref:hypothetical protein n=1 Tax=Ruminobacter sp. TaxID=2774296 RepID=UPI00387054E8